jgi:cytochrome c553
MFRPRRRAYLWTARLLLCLSAALGIASAAHGAAPRDQAGEEFFEKQVRPLLVKRCLSCHGDDEPEGGLRLTSRAAVLQGGKRGPAAVAGKPDESRLVLSARRQAKPAMPPKEKDRLPAAEVDVLARWVALGLPWPSASGAATGAYQVTDAQRRHWAFQPVRAVEPPPAKNAAWPYTAIDRFILAKLEAERLTPAAAADRRTLVRRATFDLTGLPPTPEEMENALNDKSALWFAKVVDRLLASPHYGERWGRHWLDAVRYTDYYQADPKEHGESKQWEFLEAYRYRDWVVDAFNRDLPFDQFITHQIAGDLLPSPTGAPVYPEGRIASGFLVIGSWDPHDADKDKIVSDIVDDQIDTVGKSFLGLTLGCARCHAHKFDPVSQEDYYGLAGMFYSTRVLDKLGVKGGSIYLQRLPLVPPAEVTQHEQQQARLKKLDADVLRLSAALAGALLAQKQTPLAIPLLVPQRDRLTSLLQERVAWRKDLRPLPVALAVQDGGTPGGIFPNIQDVPLHIRGAYTRLGPVIPRRLPAFFAGSQQAPITKGSGRLELARWIARPDHPLTARVLVNRVWQQHFGEGIVRSPNNFGMLGEPPTHPELLDWLAHQFVADGWSIKKLHRRIMLSAVYQQSSNPQSTDPDNRWLSRMNPRRLEAEAIRDAMLAVAGKLERTRGGPATVRLDVPRRSLYVATTRWDRSNFSSLFDAANPEAATEKRTVSTVAPQALFLLHDKFVLGQARDLAARLRGVAEDDAARIRQAYLWLYGRPASAEEVRIGQAFLQRSVHRGADTAWADYAHVLLCSNEFIYVD